MADQANPKYFKLLANAGFSVFAVPENSKNAGPWKQYQTERATVFDILEWESSRCNIGIATGEISGCFVLDVDNAETMAWLSENRDLPKTLTVSTPRGFHFYYKFPDYDLRNRADLRKLDPSLPKGLDIRGNGGFIMGAGSYYVPSKEERAKGKVEGPYRFLDGHGLGEVEMSPAPQWLLDVLYVEPYVAPEYDDRPIPDAYAAKAYAAEIDAIMSCPSGSRNDQVNKSAYWIGQLVGAGAVEEKRAERDLIDAARLVGQGKDEATASVKSGLKAGIAKPRKLPVRDEVAEAAPSAPVVAGEAPSAPAEVTKPFGHDAFKASEVTMIEAPEQEWVIEDFVPLGAVTSLFGDGGVGKTLLGQTMASHIASGEPFADREVRQMPVAAFLCEDDAAELNRRQRRINARLFDDDQVEDFTILSRVGEDNVLGVVGNGKWEPTNLYRELEAWVVEKGIRVLIIDNIMQVFGGDINDNQAVTWFVNSLTRLARRMNGAVILLGHIAKAENSKFSGSMAWNNSVRARLFLSRGDAEPGSGLETRQLTVEKSNYGKTGLTVEFALYDGVLIDKRSVSTAEAEAVGARVVRARAAVKTLIEKEDTKSISLSHQSPAYVFTPERLCTLRKAGAPMERDVKIAINEMLADGTLKKETREWSDTAKKKRERIVLAPSSVEKIAASVGSANRTIDEILGRKEAA